MSGRVPTSITLTLLLRLQLKLANKPEESKDKLEIEAFAKVLGDEMPKETCTADSQRKGEKIYLLYDVYYGERFNFRKSIIRRVGDTLRMLRVHTDFEWVLVLPPFRESYSGYPEWPKWSEFFDTSGLTTVLGSFIEYADYMAQVGGHIDVVVRKEVVTSCGDGMVKYGVEKAEGDGLRFKLMGVDVSIGKFSCHPGVDQVCTRPWFVMCCRLLLDSVSNACVFSMTSDSCRSAQGARGYSTSSSTQSRTVQAPSWSTTSERSRRVRSMSMGRITGTGAST